MQIWLQNSCQRENSISPEMHTQRDMKIGVGDGGNSQEGITESKKKVYCCNRISPLSLSFSQGESVVSFWYPITRSSLLL